MIKLNKLAMGVAMAVAAASTGAVAGTLATTSKTIGVEAATTGTLVATSDADKIEIKFGADVETGERVYLTLSNGATFNDSTYILEESAGGAGIGDTTEFTLVTASPVGATELEFRVAASTLVAGKEYLLSGSTATAQGINVKVGTKAAGEKIQISGTAKDVIGTFDTLAAADLFSYANQFAGVVDAVADATIDVNENRLKFTGAATSDVIGLDFVDTTVGTGVSLTDNDKVDITLSGDMSGIKDIVVTTDGESRGTMTIDEAAGTATFSASASDVYAAAGSTLLTANVWGSSALATRSFTVMADLNFETETDKNLVAENTSAGEWGINGLQAKVSHLSLNASGFISWLKIVNEGTTDAEISADIIWTLADGTEGSVSGASLGTVDKGGIFTVSEAALLTAMGNPTQLVDVSATVTVAGQVNKVHITAEKKASNGRVSVPVYYNTTTRDWVQ